MPIPADRQRITWDLSRILLPFSIAKRYGGLAAAALAAAAVFFLFSHAGGPWALISGGALFGLLWWALRFWALRRAARAFGERFPEWSSERPVALDVLKTMTAEPGAERLCAALPGSSPAVVVEAPVQGPAASSSQAMEGSFEASVAGLLGGSPALADLLKKNPGGLNITQTSVNGKVEVLVNGKPADPELAAQLLKAMPALAPGVWTLPTWLSKLGLGAFQGNLAFNVGATPVIQEDQGDQPADQKIQGAVAALDTGFEPIPIQGKGRGTSQPAGASGSASSQKTPRWMPLQPDEHRPQGEPGGNTEGK